MTLKLVNEYIEFREAMKILNLLTAVLISISLFIFPAYIKAQDESSNSAEIDVYAMFWPVVPGKTINDSMFWVKQLKESFGDIFSFGDINKSKYQISLSEKRLVEAYKLFTVDKDYSNAEKTLEMNKANRDKAVAYMKKAQEEKRKVGELKTQLVPSLENQQLVLKSLLSKLPEENKVKVNKIVEELTLQISEAK